MGEMYAKIKQRYAEVALGDIQAHPKNPNQGDIGAIATSIEENGFYGAIVVQESTGHILAGNHRWQAAKIAGLDRVPVTFVDVSDRLATKIMLADNRTAELATRDGEALTALLTELAYDDDLLGTGYDGDDLDEMLKALSPIDPDDWDMDGLTASAPEGRQVGYKER
jgi:ParB-like chromosome segregation protein Spo0J